MNTPPNHSNFPSSYYTYGFACLFPRTRMLGLHFLYIHIRRLRCTRPNHSIHPSSYYTYGFVFLYFDTRTLAWNSPNSFLFPVLQ
ncbi:MAG: hypothetical protein ACI37O_00820, partial [Candidatus Avelusimicrobium sp.]|uniref:hypothetical protein n=1 Tax=Candidatus Avelusimicrobium sp. TaxID=3048833 RepID=UPI003F062A58